MRRRLVILALALAAIAGGSTALAVPLQGTRGPDHLVGTPAPDRINGRAGDDQLDG
ncbi:MAG: hypothetical protein QOH83_1731, partial [Solirubrobacteraceae bacterium]|nr:hypothetical protein [Solirubrobacteraceae bacterium]